jgi:hypothetical protein
MKTSPVQVQDRWSETLSLGNETDDSTTQAEDPAFQSSQCKPNPLAVFAIRIRLDCDCQGEAISAIPGIELMPSLLPGLVSAKRRNRKLSLACLARFLAA